MPLHALAGNASRPVLQALEWHDSRPRATLSSPRGWLWLALIAASFFYMSNPLVFVPSFYLSLGEAMVWTKVVVVLSLPWLRLPRVPWPWLLFLALCLLSQFWTINPFHTDVSITVYLQITALAVVVAANCEPEVVAWGMGLGGVAVVALSLHAYQQELVGASNTAIGGADFTGVGTNENILAYTLAVSLAAVMAVGWPRRSGPQVAWVLVLAVHSYGIYLSGSGTGFVTVLGIVVAAALIAAWPTIRRTPPLVALAWFGTAGLLLVASLLTVTVLLDKDLITVSGRAPFWNATIGATLDEAPILGSGWGAVWAHPWDPTPSNDVVLDIYARADDSFAHGHNFFVDVLPELGLTGVLIAVVMVVYAVRAVHRSGLRRGSVAPMAGRLVLLVLVALLVSGITEPMLTVPLGWWSLALVVALSRQRVLEPGDRAPSRAQGRRVASRQHPADAAAY